LPTIESGEETWLFSLADSTVPGSPSILKALKDGEVDDIIVNFTYEGQRHAWV
jgi:hypothetical protein